MSSNRQPLYKKRTMRSILIKTVILILLGITAVLVVYLGTAPLNTLRYYNESVISDSLFVERYDTLYDYQPVAPLVKEKIFKESLLKLSETDSIQLVVNLPDSAVSLYIKGVKIHQSKISFYQKDRLFGKLSVMEQVYMFSHPIQVVSQYSTIIKEPVFMREAPKDTIEAALNAWLPDTVIQDPAFLIMSAENKIDLIFEQENNLTRMEKTAGTRFNNRIKSRSFAHYLKTFITLKKADYRPRIYIKIPAEELRSIYRALPVNTYFVIKIG